MAASRTINDLIKDILLLLNIVNPSETPTAADAQMVYGVIQDVLNEWSSPGLVNAVTTEYFAMVVGTAAYTIGENGSPTVNTERPEEILRAWVRDESTDTEVKLIGQDRYNLIAEKTTAGEPEFAWVNYTGPNVTITLYPVPDSTDNFYFVSVKPFNTFTAYTENILNTTLIPLNYYNALKQNVAVEVAPYFEKQVPESLYRRAINTKSAVIGRNMARDAESAAMDFVNLPTGGSILGY